MESLSFLYSFSSLFIFYSIKLSLAADTIYPGGFIRDGETLVSQSQNFELGFFSPKNSKKRYMGIWFKKSPEPVVWVANRNNPIIDSNGVLSISDNGNLVLLNETEGIIWSSNMSRKLENPVAQLLDTGNLVLRDNFGRSDSEIYLWQSFDYPSDTLLPGMRLGWNLKTGLERYLSSWRSADDPSPGEFTFRFDVHVLPQLAIYKGSMKMMRTGPWNGVFFGGVLMKPNLIFELILVHNEDEYSYSYVPLNNPIVVLVKLNESGMTQGLLWNKQRNEWDKGSTAPEDLCQYYGKCGVNGICRINDGTPICECLKGFTRRSKHNQPSSTEECVRSFPLDCDGRDGFIKLAGIKLPDLLDVSLNESMSLKECEIKCSKNCSCGAYANFNITGAGSGCLMWHGDLIDVRKFDQDKDGQDTYIRVPASELDKKSNGETLTDQGIKKNKGDRRQLWIIVIVVISLMIFTLSFIILCVRRKLTRKGENLLLFDLGTSLKPNNLGLGEVNKPGRSSKKEIEMPLFSFSSVSTATNTFSATNKLGEGGFGSVYKGTLLKGDMIAVKRLSRRSGQGWEELKNEALLIAKLQHKNLVRLLGCCIERDEKILIYEYMPNKSLDFFLFDSEKRRLLDWGTRVRIIEGIAQGLLYLHHYSRLRIIHRDLKASNILLDRDMNPKISDFGMARIFGVNEIQANTKRIVGTYGYMSPEYALQGVFSVKSDVFSFGVLLLEIITGKRNTDFHQTIYLHLIGYAWDMWTSNRGLELMDPVVQVSSSKHTLLRYVNIALLCVQESADDRPTMADVVSMLINENAVLPSPKSHAFSHLRSMVNSKSSPPEKFSINNVTVSVLEGR